MRQYMYVCMFIHVLSLLFKENYFNVIIVCNIFYNMQYTRKYFYKNLFLLKKNSKKIIVPAYEKNFELN